MSAPDSRSQERTWLAWRRTVAAALVLSLLLTRAAVVDDVAAAVVPSLALAVLAAILWVSFLRGGRWSAPSPRDPAVSLLRDGRVPASVTVVVVALATLVVVLVWA